MGGLHHFAFARAWTLLGLLALLLTGCTSEKIVFREPFNPPPDAVNKFLGYFTSSDNQTTCGNCHVGHQADWVQTKHASAYENLLSKVPNAAPECFNCHAVTARGNAVGLAGDAGAYPKAAWEVVKDTAYYDVQCESCHGPGFDHVQAPDDPAKWPLARANVFDPQENAEGKATCGACHNNEGHTPFVEQWAQSSHGNVEENSHGGESCGANCHSGKTALARFKGVRTNYVELSENGLTYEFSQTCAVCHDPHSARNEHQLRAPVTTDSISVNLCTQCHNNSAKPSLKFTPITSLNVADNTLPQGQRGAHGAQGPVVFGDAGWEPDGLTFQGPSSHGNASRNPTTCAGCHVVRFTVDDPEGNFQFQSVGHLFMPIPCLDADGLPTADDSCPITATARNWSGCTANGCHADANVASQLLNTERATIATLAEQLWQDSNDNGYLDPAPTDQGYLAQVLRDSAAAFTDSTVSTVAEKVFYNTILFSEIPYRTAAGSDFRHLEGSKGVHNPFYYEAMLAASINAVKLQYGLSNPTASVRAVMDKALRRPGVNYEPPVQIAPH
jgi:predicted CXXCH cytochrome family protein